MPLHQFIQKIDPALYGDYQKERILAGLWVKGSRTNRLPDASFETGGPQFSDKVPSASIVANGDDPLRLLKRIDTLKPTHYARQFCEKRLLPDLTLLYHCPYFYTWTNSIIPGKFKGGLCVSGSDYARLVIPFFDKEKRLIAFQGRAYNDHSGAKYITIRVDENAPKIWGTDHLHDGIVYAFEGPLDAMFIPNGIAFAGGDHTSLKSYDVRRTVVVFDNEPRSKETKRKFEKALRAGFGIVVWPKHLKEKDVNAMVLNGIKPDSILEIIQSHTFRGLAAEAELANWSHA
jgi:hypothetical protein